LQLRTFYRRRLRRLYPTMATVLLAFIAITLVEHEVDGLRLRPGLLSVPMLALYLGNLSRWLTAPPLGVQHLWTLATEEQFYLVWPPMLFMFMRRRLSPRVVLGVLVMMFLAIVAYRAALSTVLSDPYGRLYNAPDTTFDAIALGCILGVARAFGITFRFARSWFPVAVAPLALLAYAAIVVAGPASAASGWYTWGLPAIEIACACIVIACVDKRRNLVSAICSTRPLVALGRISYSLYLVHPLVLLEFVQLHHVMQPLPAVGVSLLAAWMLHRLVERRFRLPRTPRERHLAVPALATIR
jgi:peptidoglycan/LPS O-acetylase OafA/YrhL